jgi:hypothetical protein
MANQLIRSLTAALLLAAGTTGAFAQNTGTSAADAPVFQWGGDFRLRFEAYDNVHTLRNFGAHDRDYFRARLRLWETTNPLPGLTLFGRISTEPRYWYDAATPTAEGTEWKYVILDSMNAKWVTESSGTPITVVAGRQDIVLGDGWLVSDGTPIDGSWTNHFDGLRVTIDAKDMKTKFDVIAFNQQALPGDRVPTLGRDTDLSGKKYYLQEQDETGLVLYASNKSLKNTQIDGYFVYKADSAVSSVVTTKGYNSDIYTVGTKFSGTPAEHWQYSVEGAYQWGRRNDVSGSFTPAANLASHGSLSRDVSAYGLNAKLTYLFKDKYSNQISLITECLSGDKRGSTGKDEMFDVLWGRTPRISEVWAVAQGQETGRNSQYNNLFRLGASWGIVPMKDMSVTATYNALFALEDSPTRTTSTLYSRDSNFRGHLFQAVVKQKFTKTLSGLVLAEYCPMGDFYTHHDSMTFLRVELVQAF